MFNNIMPRKLFYGENFTVSILNKSVAEMVLPGDGTIEECQEYFNFPSRCQPKNFKFTAEHLLYILNIGLYSAFFGFDKHQCWFP